MQEVKAVEAVENPFEFTYERAIAVNDRANRLSDLSVLNAGQPGWQWELMIQVIADLREHARMLQENYEVATHRMDLLGDLRGYSQTLVDGYDTEDHSEEDLGFLIQSLEKSEAEAVLGYSDVDSLVIE